MRRVWRISATRTPAGGPVGAIAVLRCGDVELELVIARIRSFLAEIPLQAACPQARSGDTPFNRLLQSITADPLGPGLEDAVLHHDFVVLVEARRQVIQKPANDPVPALRQILSHAADTEPIGMHPRPAACLNNLESPP